jgi:hypothetical protein
MNKPPPGGLWLANCNPSTFLPEPEYRCNEVRRAKYYSILDASTFSPSWYGPPSGLPFANGQWDNGPAGRAVVQNIKRTRRTKPWNTTETSGVGLLPPCLLPEPIPVLALPSPVPLIILQTTPNCINSCSVPQILSSLCYLSDLATQDHNNW